MNSTPGAKPHVAFVSAHRRPKTSSWLVLIAILTALDARAQAPLPPTTDGAVAVEAGPHHRVWQTVTTDQYGRAITNSYTEVETCMNFFEPSSGLWQPSESNFEIPNEGYAVARKGQHQLIVSPALNDANGAVDLLTPDGKRFRSTILGINLYDRLTGKSLLLAELTNSVVGELISPNQVLFPRCFDALDADVRVTYEKDAFHQDVIFHQKLDLDRLAAVGFSLKTARLEVWTEFFEAPEPQVTRTVLESESDPLLRTL